MLRQLGLLFFIYSLSFVAGAEDDIRYYDIEVILFEHLDQKNHQSEDWKARRLAPQSEQAELSHELGMPYVPEAESPYDPDAMFVVLPETEQRLGDEARLIEKSSSRRILSHFAWRQPGLAKDHAIWVQFKNLVPESSDANTPVTTKLIPVNAEMNSVDFLTGDKTFHPYVEGKIKVMLARYLHVDTDILYFAEPASLAGNESEAQNTAITADGISNLQQQPQAQHAEVYLLKQLRRRIRSTELHYLDNPVIGMLLLITPYEKPETSQVTNPPAGPQTTQ